MHVRVIPYLEQYVQYNFKNILIYIYKQVHKRKAVRWINVLGDIYISVDRNDTCTSQEKNDHPQIRLTVLHIPPRATFCYFSAD